MKNFKFTLWLFALFMIGWSTQAQNVQIGSGTTTQGYFPIYGYYGYSYTQQIYTQPQVNTSGNITKIRFYFSSGTTPANNLDWVVYMGHTAKTSFSSTTDWIPVAEMNEVFNGVVTFPAAGNWMEITLTTPFPYNNADNLVIAVDENTSGYNTTTWRSFTSGSNTGIYYGNDSTNPDPSAPPTATGRNDALAQVQLYFLESCPGPSNIVFSNIGTDHADVNWTSNGTETQWKIKYGISGFNVETEGTLEDVSSKPHTISSLTANTAYHVYVKADCGGDQSAWVGPVSFRTACAPFDVLPYTESFDTWGTGSAAFPDCWTRPVTFGTTTFPSCIASTASPSTPNNLKFSSAIGTPTYAVTPAFAEDIHNLMVSFQLKREGVTSGSFQVGVMSNPSDISTFELVQTITPTQNSWTSYEVFFDATVLSGVNNYIAFRHVTDADNYFYWLDDVSVDLIPACPKPTTLFADNITASSASLNWTEVGSATAWNLKVSALSAFVPTETGEIFDGVATGNPHAISGLTPNTTYYYYVQANCGGDVSEWSAKGTFTTECGVNTPPFSEDFSTYLPECWTRFGGILADPTVVGTSTSWIADGFANVGTTGAARLEIWGTTRKEWLASPSIDLGDGSTSYVLSFDLALTKYSSILPAVTTGTDDKFAVVISTDNGATWSSTNALRLWDNAGSSYVFNNIATTGESVIIDLSGRTGVVKIGFYGESTISNADNDLFIDNFAVREMSSENDILAFSFAEQTGPAVINAVAHTVAIEVAMNTVLTALTPTIAISNYASITPASGTAQDFSSAFAYTVTSESGIDQIWTVTVTESATQSSEKDILTFVLPGQTGPATIGANTIDIEVDWLSDLSSLTPTITVSVLAAISPLSGVVQNFSAPVTYTVTAEDGTTKDYLVTVTPEMAPLGANCANPFVVDIPTALPYEDLSQTNCGLGNVYDLSDQDYTTGEDAIYRLDVASNTVVKITMSTSTTYTGLFLFDGCPDTGTIITSVTNYGSSDRVITQALTAGTYYVMIDIYPSPDCIPAYDLTIETVCPAVTAIQTVNLTATSTDLQWTAGGFETAWNVKVNATSTIDPLTVDGDIVANASVSTAAYSIASGLNPETTYHVYVQSNCGSDWTHFSFTTPSACPVPTGIATSDITANSATLSWNELGVSDWLIKVSTTSLTDPEAETADFANNTAVSGTGTFGLTGLSANTTYYWYVKSACGSAWSTEGEFTTECSAFSVPFAENFDTWGTGSAAFPDCWKRPVMYSGYSADFPSIVSANSVSSPNSLRFQSLTTEPTYAITPAFAEDIHDLMVTFSLRREGENSGSIVVGVMSNPNDPNTFELVQTITPTDNVHNLYDVMFDATLLSGANNYIAFKHVSLSSYSYYWLDDVAVDLIPSCPKPKDLFVDNLTATSALLNWTEMGTTTAWNLKVSTSATFDPTIETADIYDGVADGNPHSLTGLAENTTYYWYVQADCGGGDLSDWSVQSMFATPCEAISAFPFYEGFESGYTDQNKVGGCWLQESISGTQVWRANSSLTSYNRTPRTGNFNAYLQWGNKDWMYYAFDLTAGVSYKVDLYARQDATSGANITVSYGTNPASASMTNPIIPQTDVTNDDYQLLTGDFTPVTSGTYFIGIFGELTSTPYHLSIDDFTVDILPQINQIDINNNVANVSVCQGEAEATAIAALAPQITITDTKDAEYVVDLTWTIASYDATTPAVYTATGAFTLPTGVFQTSPVTPLAVTANVTVNAPATPTFNFATNYCIGATADALPASSIEGITGTWNATTIATDVVADVDYVFTFDAGQCATNATVAVTVHALPVVTCNSDFTVMNVNPVTLTSTPAGGTHTGTGITPEGRFSANGLENDDYTITYTYTDATTGCSNSCEFIATVFVPLGAISGIDVYNSVQDLSVCQGVTETDVLAMLTDTITIKDGANNMYIVDLVWSIASFDANTPASYNATGTFVLPVEVSQTDPATALEVAATIAVNAPTVPAFSFATEYCHGEVVEALPLTSDNGITGTWNPAIVATDVVANVDYVFTFDAGQCATNATVAVTVNAPVTPIFDAVGPFCEGSIIADLPLTSTNGITGTWSPVINNATTTEYTFTPEDGECATTQTLTIEITPNVTPTFDAVGPFCEGSTIAELSLTSTNGITGTWSPAINNAATTEYTFTPEAGECATTQTLTIEITPKTVPAFDAVGPFCEGSTIAELPLTSTNGIVGTWSPAINNAATTEYTFTPADGECATTATMSITITPNVAPTFSFATEYCQNADGDALPLTSDNGVTGIWTPATIATNVVGEADYVFTSDAGQCASSPSVTVTVKALPEVTCPADFTVASIDAVTLTATPEGGTFDGPGVVGDMFTAIDLVDGEYTITYTYTDATTGCSNTCEFVITVDFASSINVNEVTTIGVYPNPNKGMFTIDFANISGKANYQIYDAKGSIIVNKNIHTSGNTTEDVSLNLVPGVYFIKVVTTNQTIVEKLVIQ